MRPESDRALRAMAWLRLLPRRPLRRQPRPGPTRGACSMIHPPTTAASRPMSSAWRPLKAARGYLPAEPVRSTARATSAVPGGIERACSRISGDTDVLSVVIATHDSERPLLPTLAALVPGAAAGTVREVIVADAGSQRRDRGNRRRRGLPDAGLGPAARRPAEGGGRHRPFGMAAVSHARRHSGRDLGRRDAAVYRRRRDQRPDACGRRRSSGRASGRRRSIAREAFGLLRRALGARPLAAAGLADHQSVSMTSLADMTRQRRAGARSLPAPRPPAGSSCCRAAPRWSAGRQSRNAANSGMGRIPAHRVELRRDRHHVWLVRCLSQDGVTALPAWYLDWNAIVVDRKNANQIGRGTR